MVAFGGLALKNGQVSSGGPGEHGMETWLRRARDAGIEFVVVSPNRGDAPDFLRAHWISIRPGTDTAFLLGMAHVLVCEGLEDRTFLARYCTGYERFERYLTGRSTTASRRVRSGRRRSVASVQRKSARSPASSPRRAIY